MSDRRFRFGVVGSPTTGDDWIKTVRRAADLGYSTVLMPDGLQLPSPFPSLAMAAAVAAIRARLKGWVPSGKYSLGKWGMIVNVTALVYGIVAMINMAWPRTPDAPWYDNWIVALSAAVVVGIGLVYMAVHPLHDRSTAPYSDAIPTKK